MKESKKNKQEYLDEKQTLLNTCKDDNSKWVFFVNQTGNFTVVCKESGWERRGRDGSLKLSLGTENLFCRNRIFIVKIQYIT